MSISSTKKRKNYFPDGCQICPASIESILLISEVDLYGKIYSSKSDKRFWQCQKCQSYVGCHENSNKPYGILADKDTREMRIKVHSIFDPIWQYYIYRFSMQKYKVRGKAYKWLAEEMGLKIKYCHIGMFDIEMCEKAIEIIEVTYSKSISLRNFKIKFDNREFVLRV